MDLVYIFSGGNELELKYSIRSMEKHLHGFERIFVVGQRPETLSVNHIPAPDPHEKNRARNIFEKILLASQHPDISSNFVCASDDHFLLTDFNVERLPSYNCGQLEDTLRLMSPTNYYRKHVGSTYNALLERNHSTINFNVHFPVVYDKGLFQHIMLSYDWSVPKGYLSKSLFLNSLRITGEKIKDCKIFTPKTKTAIYRKIRDAKFFSTDQEALNPEMQAVFQELYPTPSKTEILTV